VGAAVVVVEVVEVVDVVVLLVVLLVVVVVVGAPDIGIYKSLLQTPVDLARIFVLPSGTTVDVYPASKSVLDTPVANGVTYPSASEYRLKGPTSDPANVKVINTVYIYLLV